MEIVKKNGNIICKDEDGKIIGVARIFAPWNIKNKKMENTKDGN